MVRRKPTRPRPGPGRTASGVPARLVAIMEPAVALAERFEAAGRRLYLVGGTVRDALAGEDGAGGAGGADLDFTTDARPDETRAILEGFADALWLQGEKFGTVGATVAGRVYEITTHRKEAYDPDSRKPVVVFGDDLATDLSRRDFTVNAMALRLTPGEPELVDPYGGLDDLVARRLATPLAPEVSFSDDPLRMLRAARFVATLGLTPDARLVEAVTRMRERLAVVSPERIRGELDKLLCAPDPGAGLRFLVDTGIGDAFLPELGALRLEQDPIQRHKDVLAHTIAVVAKTRPERIVRLAALFHDVGKPATRAYGPDGVHFHHHDVVGARMAAKRMEALRYPRSDIDAVVRLVELHLRFHTYRMGWTDSAVRRYVRDAGPLLERLNELTRCDCTTRNPDKAAALARRMDELELRIEELAAAEELAAMRPELDGNRVMELLGVPPGRAVGEALAFLMEIRLDEGLIGEDEAGRRLTEWWRERRADG